MEAEAWEEVAAAPSKSTPPAAAGQAHPPELEVAPPAAAEVHPRGPSSLEVRLEALRGGAGEASPAVVASPVVEGHGPGRPRGRPPPWCRPPAVPPPR